MQDASLRLESIRDDQRDKYWHYRQGRARMGRGEVKGSKWLMGRKPFVKEVVGLDHAGRPVKKDVAGKKSYLDAVGTGARGVYYWYTLRHGRCYLIQEQTSRRRARKYYAIVVEGRLTEVSEAQACAFVESTALVTDIRL